MGILYCLWVCFDVSWTISGKDKEIVGILSRIYAQNNKGPEDDSWYSPGGAYYGESLLPGIISGPESAMRLITVQNCVRVRSYTLGRLPCHVMRQVGKMKDKATDFYLYELLHDQPNAWMTAHDFWAMAEEFVCLTGNFYAYKLGLDGRPVQQLVPLRDGAVQKITQNRDLTLTYHTRIGNEVKEIPQSKIFHVRGLTIDGITGVNPIENARATVSLESSSKAFLNNFFTKGMHPGAVIKHPLQLNAVTHAARREELKKKYSGLGNTHELMLLDEAMDIVFPQIKLVDAQFLEQMKMTEAQICGLFRVPLMLIQAETKTSAYASSEQFMLSYVVHDVDVVPYEQAIRRDLLTVEERKKYYAKFSVEGLLRGDFKTRMDGFQSAINTCVMNPNEAREYLDLNPYSGGEIYKTRTSTIKEESSTSEEGLKK